MLGIYNIDRDPRVPIIRKIISNIVSKTLFEFTNVLVTPDNTLVFTVLDTALYTFHLNNVPVLQPISFNYKLIEELQEDEYIQDNMLMMKLQKLYEYYMNEKTYKPVVASDNELRGNEQFEELLKLKTDDGMKFFKMNGDALGSSYFVPVFTKFPSLNKADTIGINIMDLLDGHLLVEMNIYKKKIGGILNMYYRTLDVTRSII